MGLLDKFKEGLARTRAATIDKISSLFSSGKIDSATLEELEETLLQSDLGVETTDRLIAVLKKNSVKLRSEEGLTGKDLLKRELVDILQAGGTGAVRFNNKPYVIMLVGVNGSGKTTTAGKLAYYFHLQGKRTVIAAADTFRAAAIEQMEIWAERGKARIVKSAFGADPGAVVFDAMQSAKSKGDDILIIDTAGRLQTKQSLMDELTKINRVLSRIDPTAPHEVLLVIDATTGQNGLSQARGFTSAVGVNGLIVTKLDGTARGGIVVPIHQELGLPIEFIGLGEGLNDLQPFSADLYVTALLES